jgi:threonine/homoserine/homoserine lactone efflux protein
VLEAIIQGFLLGLVLAFSFGPAFFALINTGIKYGFKTGLALASGIVISDLFCIVVFYLGASALISAPSNQFAVGIIGGIVLIGYGLYNILKQNKINPDTQNTELQTSSSNYYLVSIKGFFINLLNPFTLLFWVAVVSSVGTKFSFEFSRIVLFFSAVLATIFLFDILKVFIGNKIKGFLTHKTINIINKISGTILLVFGLVLIYRVLK